jgi:hypothetical protein
MPDSRFLRILEVAVTRSDLSWTIDSSWRNSEGIEYPTAQEATWKTTIRPPNLNQNTHFGKW